MTPRPQHSYLRAEDFRDPTFIKVRRQVALIIMQHVEGEGGGSAGGLGADIHRFT